jgi:hypothetical protein
LSGHYDLAIGAIVSTLLDPSDYFNAWYRTGGPQNYSVWHDEKFDALVDQIDREVDPAKRLALVRQTEAIMEEDPPVLPVAWEKINDVWYNYVKGHNPYDYFGIYDALQGFFPGGTTPTQIEIDNLNLTPAVTGVPESSTLGLVGLGTAVRGGGERGGRGEGQRAARKTTANKGTGLIDGARRRHQPQGARGSKTGIDREIDRELGDRRIEG